MKEPIAIVGIGCRLPGEANSPTQFWNNLLNKKDCITEIPADRWNKDTFYDPNQKALRKAYSKWGGFVKDVNKFDAEAFGIIPREAHEMDPQQRFILEVAQESFLDAGYDPSDYKGRNIGVFVGVSTFDYAFKSSNFLNLDDVDTFCSTGTSLSIVANRVSFCFDFKGPSFVVDTACSSSLMSVHLACQHIWEGSAEWALAGGVNMILEPNNLIAFSKMGLLSPHGRCKAFSEDASGFVRSEGAGMLLLKPLSEALKDQDRIYATIRATGTNQDGKTNGIAVPNELSQIKLYKHVYEKSGIDPAEVDYVEAHGTGTIVGDYVETNSLGSVIGCAEGRNGELLIGSVKTNIGHLESGSGVAGIIKAALVLKNGSIPPNIHFEVPSSRIDFEDLNLKVVDEFTKLPDIKYAAVNSFGFGGANVHIVLEREIQQTAKKKNTSGKLVLNLSATSEDRLNIQCENYIQFLETSNRSPFEIAKACVFNRKHFNHRLSVLGDSKLAWKENLERYLRGEYDRKIVTSNVVLEPSENLVFVFSGQGPQWNAMGMQLYAENKIFRKEFNRCDKWVKKYAGWSVLKILSALPEESKIRETSIAQPSITVLQIALAKTLIHYGIFPNAVIGHSIGEIAAAHISGALDLKTAIKVIAARGSVMEDYSKGGKMLAVNCPEEFLDEISPLPVDIAAINGPGSYTLAGGAEGIADMQELFTEKKFFNKMLNVDHAFHSQLMSEIEVPLLKHLRGIKPKKPKLLMVSTVSSSDMQNPDDFNPEYWWRNVNETVNFKGGVERLEQLGFRDFIEIAPHPVLSSYLSAILKERAHNDVRITPTLFRKSDESGNLLMAISKLHGVGWPVKWERIFDSSKSIIELPGYPWKKEKYWKESFEAKFFANSIQEHPLLGNQISDTKRSFLNFVNLLQFPFLRDHQYDGNFLFPATAYIESFLAVAQQVSDNQESITLKNLVFERVLMLRSEDAYAQIKIEYDDLSNEVSFISRPEKGYESWTKHSAAQILLSNPKSNSDKKIDIGEILPHSSRTYSGTSFYRFIEGSSLYYGPIFNGIHEYWLNKNEIWAEIRVPTQIQPELAKYNFHPAVLDVCIQVSFLNRIFDRSLKSSRYTLIPMRMDSFELYHPLKTNNLFVKVIKHRDTLRNSLFDIFIYNYEGLLLGQFVNAELYGVEIPAKNDGNYFDDWIHKIKWIPTSLSSNEDGIRYSATENEHEEHELNQLLNAITVEQLHKLYFLEFNEANSADWNEFLKHAGYGNNIEDIQKPDDYSTDQKKEYPILREFLNERPAYSMESWAVLNKASLVEERLLKNDISTEWNKKWLESIASVHLDSFLFRNLYKRVCGILNQSISENKSTHSFKILELNSGFGGLGYEFLSKTAFSNLEYTFSDSELERLNSVRQRLQSRTKVNFKEIDLFSESVSDILPNTYDLILCPNFSASHNEEEMATLGRHLQMSLKPGGKIILVNLMNLPLWGNFVFSAVNDQLGVSGGVNIQKDDSNQKIKAFCTAELVHEACFSSQLKPEKENSVEFEIDVFTKGTNSALELPDDVKEAGLITKNAVVISNNPDSIQSLKKRFTNEYQQVSIRTFDTVLEQGLGFIPNGTTNEMDVFIFLENYTTKPNEVRDEKVSVDLSNWYSLIEVHQQLITWGSLEKIHVFGVTEGRYKINGSSNEILPNTSVYTGLFYTMTCEYPQLNYKLIDLDASQGLINQLDDIIVEASQVDENTEIAYRNGDRFVSRIQRTSLLYPDAAKGTLRNDNSPELSYCLGIGDSNTIAAVRYYETKKPTLGALEIEVEVKATAVNFRDVLKIIGLYPTDTEDYLHLGDECAGVITRIGSDVERYSIGEKVVCIGQSCFASDVVTHQDLVFPYPDRLSFEEAATIPVVFLTAHHALVNLANIQSGETVLIHAAAGGVGLAAIQIAQHRGAKIIATASKSKHRILNALGVKHVLNSRDNSFVNGVREITNSTGVDVVLNSLAGELQELSMELLAPFGRFIEIGKKDIYLNRKTGLLKFKENISLHFLDLSTLFKDRSGKLVKMASEVFENIQKKVYHPLPLRSFEANNIGEAFRIISKGNHIGKLIIQHNRNSVPVYESLDMSWTSLAGKKTYLVTGASSGFGREIVQYLLDSGAESIVLFNRSAPDSQKINELLEGLDMGSEVTITPLQVNVSDEDQVKSAFSWIEKNMFPLKGIVHAAGFYQDQLIQHTDYESFNSVCSPKVHGAIHLYNSTRDANLEFFIFTSSVVSLLGNTGQVSYAVANSFLDSFAEDLQNKGVPALSINFGPLKNVGYLERNKHISKQLSKNGLSLLSSQQAIQILDMARNTLQTGFGAFRANFKEWIDALGMTRIHPKILDLYLEDKNSSSQRKEKDVKLDYILEADEEERIVLVGKHIQKVSAKLIGIEGSSISLGDSFQDIGLDSLMAVELQYEIEKAFNINISPVEAAKDPTITGFINLICKLLKEKYD